MGTWGSPRSRIEIKVENHSKEVSMASESIPHGFNKQAYLARRLNEEMNANPRAFNVSVSYDGQTLSKRL